ncbi:MAG: SET domain-containing protein-lysine N-methyltransferase [Verrucomicrobiales bacterium]|nr:SET domain-containing protein-lysine N-methyltransferase [Verrucomicrobiales bacterium]
MCPDTDRRNDPPKPGNGATALGSSSNPAPTPKREPVNEWLELGHSGIHGRGGFARCLIPAGTSIIEYVGDRVDKAESSRRCEDGNPFIFTINTEWDIDGNVDWNPARFLNHSCAPNCEAQQEEDRIWIVALRDIEPGEELTFNYGYDISEWRDYPCGCGATSCLGFIVAAEHHVQVRQQLEQERGSAHRTTEESGEPAVVAPASQQPVS